MAMLIELVCAYPECRKTFQVPPSRHLTAKYCSYRCNGLHGHSARQGVTLADRFWAKALKGLPHECWLWQASKGSTGYGMMYVHEQRRLVGAHVVSWFLHANTWPAKGLCVLHNCPAGDTPACVNPAHLWIGTRTDNGKDMVAKGRDSAHTHPERLARGDRSGARLHPERLRRGAANNKTKLTDAQREEIATLFNTGQWTLKRLGDRFGVTPQSIRRWVCHKP